MAKVKIKQQYYDKHETVIELSRVPMIGECIDLPDRTYTVKTVTHFPQPSELDAFCIIH